MRTKKGHTPNSCGERDVASLFFSRQGRGERWSEETLQFVESLAVVRAREAPPAPFQSAALTWRRRWSRTLSVSGGRSFASSLEALPTAMPALGGADGCAPDLANLFAEWEAILTVSGDLILSSFWKKSDGSTIVDGSTQQGLCL